MTKMKAYKMQVAFGLVGIFLIINGLAIMEIIDIDEMFVEGSMKIIGILTIIVGITSAIISQYFTSQYNKIRKAEKHLK